MAVSSLDPKKVSFSDLPTELKGLNGFYAEIGFGIENILKLLRVDFSWRLTQKNQPDIKNSAGLLASHLVFRNLDSFFS